MELSVLLVEPNEALSELIAKNLEQEFGARCTIFKSALLAQSQLIKGASFNLIISRNCAEEMENPEAMADIILNTIYDLSLKTPLIVIGEFEHAYKKYALVSEKLRIEELNRLVLKALDLKKEDFKHLKLPDYVPFPLKHFYLMNVLPVDVYIKLTKKSVDEFVKRLNQGEGFNKTDLKKYEDLGLREFYILKEDRELFLTGLMTQSLKTLKSSHSIESAVEVVGDSYVISSDLIKTLGIQSASVAMVDQTVTLMRNQITKSGKLGQLLKRILDDKLSYSFRRTYLICLLSHTILPRMEWGSSDQQASLLEKISMVSFFHDIYLEDEDLLKIMDHETLKKANITSREKDHVLNHANRAALLAQNYPRLPQGVDIIIKQHHGVTNGVGFPEALTAAISPIAIFFVVIEDFATRLLALENLSEIPSIILPLKERYQLPSYRKVVTEIESIFIKKS